MDIEFDLERFENPDDEIIMPGISTEDKNSSDNTQGKDNGSELMSEGVERAITGDVVKEVLLKEEFGIMVPNYVIDLSNVESVCKIQSMTLDAILDPEGDTAVYIYVSKSLQKLGMGNGDILNRILVPVMKNVFDEKCKVYRDFKEGEPLNIVDGKSISSLRLTI